MKHENIRWKQVLGGIFIALSLLLYVMSFTGFAARQAKVKELQTQLEKSSVSPEVMKALIPSTASKVTDGILSPPPILLLFVGIAWFWNSRKKVGAWSYGILAAYFAAMSGLLFFALFKASRAAQLPNSTKAQIIIAGSLFLAAGVFFFWRAKKLIARAPQPSAPIAESTALDPVEPSVAVVSKRAPVNTRWHSANVLDVGVHSRHLWQFSVHDAKFSLIRNQALAPNEPPPANLVAKSWNAIWQPKLNVAWLPAENVFLRVLQLPSSDFAETLSMVELQLEKISPLPVAQIVWTVEVLPKRTGDNLQTAIVIIVARDVVEEFLGQLEGQGYLADRIELPMMDELLATQSHDDGVWIYPGATTVSPYLVAWQYGGILQNVTLFSPAPGQDLGMLLKDQISQVAWAGELEGWLTSPPRWHLVADAPTAVVWEPILNQVADQPAQLMAPMSQAQLAAMSAQRSVQSNGAANLVPIEYSTRYRQQFVDRLWMRGLGAVVVVYMVGVVIYFGALQVLKFQQYRLQKQVASISQSYTNAMKMEARIRVLENRKNLQFAALDCWKAVAEILPAEVLVDKIYFSRGKTFDLYGKVPQDHQTEVTDFNEELRRVKVNKELLFSEVTTPRLDINGSTVTWKFSCKLKSGEDVK